MKIVEFRVPLPIDVEAYHRAQLYMVARSSLDERAVDVIENRPFEEGQRKGQFTKKRMSASKHLPSWIKPLFDERWSVDELSWNCFPICKTEFSITMLPRVHVSLESMHLPGYTEAENAVNLSAEKLEARKIDVLDIACDSEHPVNGLDPTKFHSAKSGLGPLEKDWLKQKPAKLMTCYKVVTVDCQLPFGFQGRVESFIIKFIRTMILNAHRKLFCWMDDWSDLSMADIRLYEKEVQAKMREIWLAERGHLPDNDVEETSSEPPRSPTLSPASPRAEEPAAKPAHRPQTEQLMYSGGIRTGYLYKLGDGYIVRSWNLRYFVLKGSLLHYFADARDARPKEVVELKGATVSWGGNEDKEHSFMISPLEHRPLVVSGRTLEDSKTWFALTERIAGGMEEPVTPPPPPPPMDYSQSPTHSRSRWVPLEDSVVALQVKLPANLPARFAEAGRLLKRGASSVWPLVDTIDGIRLSEDPAVVPTLTVTRDVLFRIFIGVSLALAFLPLVPVLVVVSIVSFWFWSRRTGHAAAVTVIPGTAKELAVWVTDTARFKAWDRFIDQAFSQQSGKTEIVNLVSRAGFINMSLRSERMHWGSEDGHFFVSTVGSDPGDCWAFRDAPPRPDGQPMCTVVLVSAGLSLVPAISRVTALIGLKLISEQEPIRVPPKLLLPQQWTYSPRGGLQVETEPLLTSLTSVKFSAFWAFLLGHKKIQLHGVFRHQGPSPPEALGHFFTALPDFFPTAHDNPHTVLLALVSALVTGLAPAAVALASVPWAKPSKRDGTVTCQLGRGLEAFWEVPEGSAMKGSGTIVLSGSSDFSLKGSLAWQISMNQLDGIVIKLTGEPEFSYRQSSGVTTSLRFSLPDLHVYSKRVAWVGYLKVWSEHARCVLSIQDDKYSQMSGVILSASLGKVERHIDGSWLDALYSDGKAFWICGAPPQRQSRVTIGSKQ